MRSAYAEGSVSWPERAPGGSWMGARGSVGSRKEETHEGEESPMLQAGRLVP